jgi:Ca-activated chloride channel family protein
MKYLLILLVVPLLTLFSPQQDRIITGKVTDQDSGEPLVGATVVVEGTSIGTLTNELGKYSLTVPSGHDLLVIQYIGFQTQKVKIGEKTNIDITLSAATATLSEVVVTGKQPRKFSNKTRPQKVKPAPAEVVITEEEVEEADIAEGYFDVEIIDDINPVIIQEKEMISNQNNTNSLAYQQNVAQKKRLKKQAEQQLAMWENQAREMERKQMAPLQNAAATTPKVVIKKPKVVIKPGSKSDPINPTDNDQPTPKKDFSGETYEQIYENPFKVVNQSPVSTFSIDVDKASYSNMRRFINNQQLPPPDAIRIEELVNYFKYDYPQPQDEHPFAVFTDVTSAPWHPENKLIHIGIKGKEISYEEAPANNLVFLIDVSGSMSSYNKLPLLQKSFNMLVDNLREKDRVAIVVYAGAAGMVLPSTDGTNKEKIKAAINQLKSGGSTAGGQGIQLAYKIAKEYFIEGGNNRVIMATDGDFNVGVSSDNALVELIEAKRNDGVFLTVLGFGTGNYQDAKMEKIADHGNGNYAYIDNFTEARKVLINEMSGTLYTIAKDVKIQIEFNPEKVKAYRLIGYENRVLAREDFDDDTKDAGELGAGHTVTALYEIVPAGGNIPLAGNEDILRYQPVKVNYTAQSKDEIMTVKLRYKKPDADQSQLIVNPIQDKMTPFEQASENLRFASAVAEFGMLLRHSRYSGDASFDAVIRRAKFSKGADLDGYRAEFIRLVETADLLSRE